jgi:hypothetical protein
MCLACELDALWYAEWERLAAEGAGLPGNAGIPSALPGDPGGAASVVSENAVELLVASSSSLFGGERGGPLAQAFEEARRAGGTPAVPGRPAAPRSGFLCEETE